MPEDGTGGTCSDDVVILLLQHVIVVWDDIVRSIGDTELVSNRLTKANGETGIEFIVGHITELPTTCHKHWRSSGVVENKDIARRELYVWHLA